MVVSMFKADFIKCKSKIVNYRDYKQFNKDLFKKELKNLLSNEIKESCDYKSFEEVFLSVLNKHAPLKSKTIREMMLLYDQNTEKGNNEKIRT